MSELTNKKSFFSKRIPTLIGLGVLVVALIAGTMLFSQGTGVFAPRATPQTTPKKIRVSNLTDSGFSVSFLTDEATVGHIKYGTDTKKMDSQASDDRDQLSGAIDKYNVHHITVRGLEPGSTYYYTLGTGSGSFDNNGQPFTIKTAQRSGVPSAAKTIYGSVVSPTGNPAEGAIVYVKAEGVGEMSSLVKSSGSWAIPLSNARLEDGSTYAQITDENALTIFIQGASASLTSQVNVLVADAQPVDNITLGESQNLADNTQVAPPTPPTPDQAELLDVPVATDEGNLIDNIEDTIDVPPATNSPSLADLDTIDEASLQDETASPSTVLMAELVDLGTMTEASVSPTIETTQPKIVGKAAPNVTISIQVHSDTQIDQYIVADSEGNFELDIAKLQQELEPGEHTVTYSYEDPITGETVTKTETFYVSQTATQIAMADTADDEASAGGTPEYPYSSSNPYPIDEATDSGEATAAARVTQPSTESAIPVSGSVGTTYALVFGGMFFILAGVWSWWIANNLEEELVV